MVATSLVTGPGSLGDKKAAANADCILHAAPSASSASSATLSLLDPLANIHDYESRHTALGAPGSMVTINDKAPDEPLTISAHAVLAVLVSSLPALLESVHHGAALAGRSGGEQPTLASPPPALDLPFSPPASFLRSALPHPPLYPQQPLRPLSLAY